MEGLSLIGLELGEEQRSILVGILLPAEVGQMLPENAATGYEGSSFPID